MFEIMVIFEIIEFEIKQAASYFRMALSVLSRSFSSVMVSVGSRIISLITDFHSTCSSTPFDLQLELVNSSLEICIDFVKFNSQRCKIQAAISFKISSLNVFWRGRKLIDLM